MKFFGVIGNRDHIKNADGEKRPYWEYLDYQPDGWLTSLAYWRDDLPQNRQMIFDCGAWSYKTEHEPKLGKNLVTPAWAFEQYTAKAKQGDMLVAPDHMLIEGLGDMDYRRQFNRQAAQEFLKLCDGTDFVAAGTAHGLTLDERIEHARWLAWLGYKAIFLGGMAGRASAKRTNVEAVERIRQELPDVWLHILGLSSPDYYEQWHRLGVDSCDGSSHFKQAFTAGTFFTHQSGSLKKFQAAHTRDGLNEAITAPLCNCTACNKLREQGIDTRTYGSNENNMGRAAHNQNMLMAAQRWRTRRSYYLVSCVGEKQARPVPAKDLYQSAWFRKARLYVEQQGADWFVISAEHGLIHKDAETIPYEKTLNTMSSAARQVWAEKTAVQIRQQIPTGSNIVVLAGNRYREHLLKILADDYQFSIPCEGLGIGQQLAWFDAHTQKQMELF